MRRNSNIIGPKQTTSTTDASGIFDTFDQFNLIKSDAWPYTRKVTLSESSTSVNETDNNTLTITVNTEGFDIITLYWTINQVSGTIIADDFTQGLSGSFSLSGTLSSSTGSINLTVKADGSPDGEDVFNVQVRTGSTSGPIIATSQNITISDTSTEGVPLSCSFRENRNGATIGSVNVYVVDSSGNIQGSAIYSASGNTGDVWSLRTTSSPVITSQFRIAWHYVSSSSFTGDYAIDSVTINGTTYNFDSSSDGFITTSGVNTASSTVALNNAITVPTSTGAALGRWNRHSGATTSSNTGPSSAFSGSFYLYAETTSPNFSNVSMWLFSPLI